MKNEVVLYVSHVTVKMLTIIRCKTRIKSI